MDKEKFTLRFLYRMIVIVMSVFMLMGCGDDDMTAEADDTVYEETTITIDKKGRIVENIVDSFSKPYYDVAEITQEFNVAIADYNNASGSDRVKLKEEPKVENKKLYAKLYFEDYESYEAVQNEEFFFGTIGDAALAGYNLETTLKGCASGDKIGRVQIMGMKDKHIVIFSEKARLITYCPVIYVSANVDVVSENEVRMSSEGGSGLAYIILEK